MINWIGKLCNMAFENGSLSADWKSAVIVPFHNGRGRGRNAKTDEDLLCWIW